MRRDVIYYVHEWVRKHEWSLSTHNLVQYALLFSHFLLVGKQTTYSVYINNINCLMFSSGIFLISSELWIKAAQRINCKQPLDCLPWQRNYKFKPLVNKVTVIFFFNCFSLFIWLRQSKTVFSPDVITHCNLADLINTILLN